MNTHQNARLTVWGRAQAVHRVLVEGEPVSRVAAAFHVTPATIRKYVRRYLGEGPAGMCDRSSRPHRSPRRTPPAVVRHVVRLRLQRLTGPEIAARLRRPRSTIGRLLQQLGMGRLHTGPTAPPRRSECAHPGELLHLDLKPLPRFAAVGHCRRTPEFPQW